MRRKVEIIAEIGECFNGDMETADKLIAAAATAGCDYAKFQTLDIDGIDNDDPERDWFLKIALDKERIEYLRERCALHGIEFLCSPEKKRQAEMLRELGERRVKIASSCVVDAELMDYVAKTFPVVFVSTGMASLKEVDAAMEKLSGQEKIYLMHCVSEYPTGPLLEKRGLRALEPSNVRLRMMDFLMERYPNAIVGYSDHTAGTAAPIAAVARGAGVLEKHITLDRTTPMRNYLEGKRYLGTDHVLSLEPEELEAMVAAIRDVEAMLAPETWERTEGEKILMDFLRGRFDNDGNNAEPATETP